ncbi:AP3D1 [Cordylochernes scorpioides]|uniref:AP3D1 n=1 Tax=Cordylochernes scorpioides TaxID=51811 RepID=A0ABY6KR13_9ARAC|nr:AP3D1 [Cordylochernes scorpioides]
MKKLVTLGSFLWHYNIGLGTYHCDVWVQSKYITNCIEEIKEELRQENLSVKANAVAKLTYLQMLGYDISWAAFNIIEVMSSTKFTFKRIGYLAASQSFHEDTEVLMLTTNMIRKDLNSQNMYDAGTAMSGLSCFVTTDLARDLANDVMTLLTSTKPYLRKKAILLIYKIFLKFPEALRPAFPRLKEKLEDPDPGISKKKNNNKCPITERFYCSLLSGNFAQSESSTQHCCLSQADDIANIVCCVGVQSAAVNVICELARKNPRNYLSLAPVFFKLMTCSTNNWMLIKIIKLFGALTPLEPRLGQKLIEPLTNLIHSTSAMSLLYECINTVIAVYNAVGHIAYLATTVANCSLCLLQLCVQKLRILIEDSDQNLKYLGLLAMSKILKTHPKSVQTHKDLVMQCLDDRDESIRLRALDLLYGMVTKKNLMEIVMKLMSHMDHAEGSLYRDELLLKIIDICSQNNYQFIVNFESYINILVDMTKLEGTKHGALIASQMMDVAIRVAAVRPYAVAKMATLLEKSIPTMGNCSDSSIAEVLYAAAWICGEFSEHLPDPHTTLSTLLHPRTLFLPAHIQAVLVQNSTKLYVRLMAAEEDSSLQSLMLEQLPFYLRCGHLEVQERVAMAAALQKIDMDPEHYTSKIENIAVIEIDVQTANILQILELAAELHQSGETGVYQELEALFSGELNPVAPKAQRKVPIPEGLDLDQWINEPPSESEDEEDYMAGGDIFLRGSADSRNSNNILNKKEMTEEELSEIREARIQEQASNPYYLKGSSRHRNNLRYEDTHQDLVPIKNIELSTSLKISSGVDKKRRHKKKKRGDQQQPASEEEEELPQQVVILGEEMPEGARSTDDEEPPANPDDPHQALNINLDDLEPYRNHTMASGTRKKESSTSKKSKKSHKKKKKKESPTEEEPNNLEYLLISPEPEEAAATQPPSSLPLVVEDTPQPPAKKEEECEQKKKSSKPSKKEKRHKSKERRQQEQQQEEPKDRTDYEEAPGITTPSKEPGSSVAQTPMTPSMPPPASAYKLLGQNEHLKLVSQSTVHQCSPGCEGRAVQTYETKVHQHRPHNLQVSILFRNLSACHMKDLEFNVLDTLNTKLLRNNMTNGTDGIKVPFQLPAGSSSEGQFMFSVEQVVVGQKLRGTLSYILQSDKWCLQEEGGTTQDKLDFTLHLPVSTYLLSSLDRRESFSELLSGSELNASSTLTVALPEKLEFSQALSRLCFHARFTVVEQVGLSASLYSRSIQDHHLCLLLKLLVSSSGPCPAQRTIPLCAQSSNRISVDAKGSNSQLLSSIMDEVRQILTTAPQ